MSAVPLWFDRKFEFTFPLEQYPNVCVRLRGAPARLEEMLRGRAREVLARKPTEQGNEKWSAQEHAGHLLDLEPLWRKRVEDFLGGGSELSVADLSNRGTTEANHNGRPLEEILSAFRKARLQLLDRAQNVGVDQAGRSLIHPRLKQPMRLVDHLFFVAEHDDHHLAKIWELVSPAE